MHDLTNFITNQKGYTLLNRLAEIFPNTQEFDCLVAYLYFNGLKLIVNHLDNVEKIRILVGLGVDNQIRKLFIKQNENGYISDLELKDFYQRYVIKTQVEDSNDDAETENAILKFKELISVGKLQIRVYKSSNLHAKVYIMKYRDGHDPGIVITGSSNLTESGLQYNLEFNVQLRDPRDYEYARNRFEELWKFGVDISEDIVKGLNQTHLSTEITPYEIYLKFLYEYFQETLEFDESKLKSDFGDKFLDFEYQRQAVIAAIGIIRDHGGVFLSDVVGLGKTYIAAIIAKQLDGDNLVIAPPALIDENNPGSWRRVFKELKVKNTEFVSIGKLSQFNIDDYRYENVFIDESHRFRNENTKSHDKLMEICHGKKVILVSATPFNNYPKDLLAQIKLFQNTKNSTIPGILNLEKFFAELDSKLSKASDYDRKNVLKEVSREIRNKVLRHVMIRRTRSEILRFYKTDLEKNHIKFPEIKDPNIVYYQLNSQEEQIFNKTVELIKKFKYTRYKPLTYLKAPISEMQKTSQENMVTFMKTLLIKRFDSSIYAFKKTLDRFERSYNIFKQSFEKGKVYISKEKSNYELSQVLVEDDDQKLFKLLEEGKAEEYLITDFKESFYQDLETDLKIIQEIKNLWAQVVSDPKLGKLIELLKNELFHKKVIIFTESKETSEYLTQKIQEILNENVLTFNGSITSKEARQKVVDNFDANAKDKKDDYRILITTEVLAEGVNLHRSNIIINYDIPWNPTRVIQRVGRLNRVGTRFDYIYIYNFFPTAIAEDEINLKELAINKFNMFIELLGTDSKLLTETDEVKSHILFNTLNSRILFNEDDDVESELIYLKEIEEIKNNNPSLYNKIKCLPRKIRSCKESTLLQNSLVSYFKKGNIDKFILFSSDLDSPKEIDFFDAVKYIKSLPDEQPLELPNNFYDYLNKNKHFFDSLINTIYDNKDDALLRGNPAKLNKRLKAVLLMPDLSGVHRAYINLFIQALRETSLNKIRLQYALKEIGDSYEGYYIYNILTKYFSEKMLKEKLELTKSNSDAKRLIILSMYFK